MRKPIIHLNGSSKASLIKVYEQAAFAIGESVDYLQDTAPDSRDYYVSPDPTAFSEATKEHLARMEKLNSVMKEMDEMIEYLYDLPE